jgi:metal-responsive CopG/Arc/MetJ family transcriptional regulator
VAEERLSGTSATRAKNKYNAKAYDQFRVLVPKGDREKIDRAAKEQGYKSRNEFVIAAIWEKIGKEKNVQ